MSIFNNALSLIEQNRNNKHNCIPYEKKLPRFSEYLPGIEKKRYYLISGASGAGKSQFTDDFFIFTPYDFTLEEETDITVKYIYYSLELDKISKMHQWMSRRLYTHYGIRSGMKVLQSVGKNRLNDNLWMAVQETREYFERLEDVITMYDGTIKPSMIEKDIEEYAMLNGKFNVKEVLNEQGDLVKVFDNYIPNRPKEYVMIILDHYSLLSSDNGSSIKQTIEDVSKTFVKARNKYSYIPVPIQQQSASGEDLDHFKSSKLLPSKDTLGESKLTYNDCDLAIGIFEPQKHEIKSDRGYNIFEMRDGYRYINIFKNRYGTSNVGVGLYFDGAVNFFKELPKSDQINSSHYEMIKNRKPNW